MMETPAGAAVEEHGRPGHQLGIRRLLPPEPNRTAPARPPRRRAPMIVDPPDGKVPLQPWAMDEADRNHGQSGTGRVPRSARALPAVGRARANLPVGYNTYQILQIPGYVVLLYEWNHMYRYIPLDGRPHVNPKIRMPMGDSRGRWEGNTLVVDVTNFTDRTWVVGHGAPPEGAPASALTTGHGVFHTEALHVVERFTLIDARHDPLRGDDRGSQGVHAAVDDSTSMPSPGRPPIISCSSMRATRATVGNIKMMTGFDYREGGKRMALPRQPGVAS